MRFMPPHKMITLGATVTGYVDETYEVNDLCDGDPSFPIRNTADGSPSGSASYAISGTSGLVEAIIVANHNLDEGAGIDITGALTDSALAPPVPPGDIRLNVLIEVTPNTVSGFTITFTDNSGPIIVGEVLAGEFLTMRTLPPNSSMGVLPFEVPSGGEYEGLSQDRRAEARTFGGSVYVQDTTKRLLDDWYRACKNNSLPSVIIPIDRSSNSPSVDTDPWVVKWVTYAARPYVRDIWQCDVAWQELPRYRWP